MFFGGGKGFSGFYDVLVIPPVFVCQSLRRQVVVCFADNFFQREIHRAAKLLVRKGELAIEVFTDNVLRDGFHKRMVQQFRITQGQFNLFLLGDVNHSAFVVEQFAVIIAYSTNIF